MFNLLYHAAGSLSGPDFVLSPAEASQIPSINEIGTRMPELPSHQLEALREEYELEEVRLRRLMDNADMEEWFEEAKQRVESEVL